MPDPALLDRLRRAVDAGFARQTGFIARFVADGCGVREHG